MKHFNCGLASEYHDPDNDFIDGLKLHCTGLIKLYRINQNIATDYAVISKGFCLFTLNKHDLCHTAKFFEVPNSLKSDYPPPEEVALTPIFASHREFFCHTGLS